MLTPPLDPGGGSPLYEQLYRFIRTEIETGRLAAGERLPSKRTLASHLRISVVTVEGAYAQLLSEGYTRSEPKRGFFVQSVADLATPQPPVRASLPPSPRRPTFRYDFATNAVDTAHFPFSTWAKLMREVLSQDPGPLLEAAHPQGALPLRVAIAGYLRDFRGIRADPEQIVVGAGSEYLTGLLVQLLGREGGYGVENPGYPKIHRIFSHGGARVVPIPMDRQGLCVADLAAEEVRVVHVTPSHHFPLGTVMPIARRNALLRWAGGAPDCYIIEDDYDSEFRFSGRPIPALQSLDSRERVIYLNTFAKSLAPSLRIGYMVLPPHLLERYRAQFLFYSSTVPSFEQYTLAVFMERGHFERHIARMRTVYKSRKEALLTAAREAGLRGNFSGSDAGQHLLFAPETGLDETSLVRLAELAGVGLYPLSACYLVPPHEPKPPTLIMGYSRLEAEEMTGAIACLSAAWARNTGTGAPL